MLLLECSRLGSPFPLPTTSGNNETALAGQVGTFPVIKVLFTFYKNLVSHASVWVFSELCCPFNEFFFNFRDYKFLFLIFTMGSFLKVSLSLLKSLTSSAMAPIFSRILYDINVRILQPVSVPTSETPFICFRRLLPS